MFHVVQTPTINKDCLCLCLSCISVANRGRYYCIWSKAVIIATIEFTIYNKNIVNSIAVINIQAIMAKDFDRTSESI